MQTSPLGLPTVGARHPRVDYHPDYDLTFGPEAIELAQTAGLFLDPWQQDSLNTMLAVRSDGKWQCFESAEIVSRQNGKGSILEARVLAGFVLFGEQLIMWSAHEYKTAIELFLRVKQLIRTLIEAGELDEDDIKVIHGNNPGRGFERLSTGQRITFIARSDGSGRGFSGDVNIIDEAYAYTRAQQSALMPTMSARPNPQILYASSPPLDGETAEVLFALRRRGDRLAPRVPEDGDWEPDPSLSWRDWGAAGDLDELDEMDLGDPDMWAATNPALGGRITVEFVMREFRSMGRLEFARERCGIWPREVRAEGGGAIDLKAWAEMADAESKREGDVAVALAVAQDRSWGAMAVRGLRSDGLAHWEVIEHRAGPPTWMVARAVAFKAKHADHLIGFVVDERGPAGSLVPKLEQAGIKRPEKPDEPQRGDLAVTSAGDMAAAFGLLQDAVEQRAGRHRDDPRLNSSIGAAKKRVIGDGAEALGRKGAADITCIESVTLANWLYESWAHLVVDHSEFLEYRGLSVG